MPRGRPPIDLVGQRFQHWLVIARAPNHGFSNRWVCRCDCGTERTHRGWYLRHGKTRAHCGCLTVPKPRKPYVSRGTGRRGPSTPLALPAGTVIGTVTILGVVDPNSTQYYRRYYCRCACGHEYTLAADRAHYQHAKQAERQHPQTCRRCAFANRKWTKAYRYGKARALAMLKDADRNLETPEPESSGATEKEDPNAELDF